MCVFAVMLHMIYTHTCTTTTYLGEKGEHSVSRRLDLVVASIVIGTTGNQDAVRFRMGGGGSHFLTTHTQLYKVSRLSGRESVCFASRDTARCLSSGLLFVSRAEMRMLLSVK
jgi:hypothetical protein